MSSCLTRMFAHSSAYYIVQEPLAIHSATILCTFSTWSREVVGLPASPKCQECLLQTQLHLPWGKSTSSQHIFIDSSARQCHESRTQILLVQTSPLLVISACCSFSIRFTRSLSSRHKQNVSPFPRRCSAACPGTPLWTSPEIPRTGSCNFEEGEGLLIRCPRRPGRSASK